jgi:hypothetical protein
MQALRLSEGIWQVRIGRDWHKVTVLDGDPSCIPMVIKVDGREADDCGELADLIASKIYDENLRNLLREQQPGCGCH